MKIYRTSNFVVFLAILFLLGGCTYFPRDPQHSFDQAKASGLKVGITSNPPFTQIQNGRVGGTEVALIEKFARAHGLDVNYVEGSESQLIKKLEALELHIVAGGFDKKTIWISKAALSASYDGRHVFLLPKGENQLLYRLEKQIFEAR